MLLLIRFQEALLITRPEGSRVEVSTHSGFFFCFVLFLVVSRADAQASRRARNRDGR